MADDDHRVGEADEELLQPGDGLDIQVVGRLVEQEDVRVAEQGLGKEHAHLVACLEFLHAQPGQVLADAQAAEQHPGLGLGLVAVQLAELDLQVAAADAVRLGQLGLGVEQLAFAAQVVEPLVPADNRVEHGLLVVDELVLLEHGDALPRADGHLALIRFLLAGEDAEKGRLAGAVGADQAVAVAMGELDVDVLEDDALAVGQGDVGRLEHGIVSFQKKNGRDHRVTAGAAGSRGAANLPEKGEK